MTRKASRIILAAIVLIPLVVADRPAAAPKFSDWSAPVNLGPVVNSASLDQGPAISKDGLSLYFGSNRLEGPTDTNPDLNIWVSQRASLDDDWGPPVNLTMINTSAIENVPALSRDGHWLFFNSNRPGSIPTSGGTPSVDIWASYREHVHNDFAWQPPVNLGPLVNSAFFDGGATYFESDDLGTPLLFFGSGRPGGPGLVDIYVSAQLPDGSFGPASLIAELSTPQMDQRPAIRFDGLELFLFSNRDGTLGGLDLWVATRETVANAWSTPVNLGSTINTTSVDQQAY